MADDATKIIPGHQNLSNKKELEHYLTMLISTCDIIKKEIKKGKTLEAVKQNTTITKAYDATHGVGFIKSEVFRATVYKSLKLDSEKKI